jgi:hypothetical protein
MIRQNCDSRKEVSGALKIRPRISTLSTAQIRRLPHLGARIRRAAAPMGVLAATEPLWSSPAFGRHPLRAFALSGERTRRGTSFAKRSHQALRRLRQTQLSDRISRSRGNTADHRRWHVTV